MKKIIFIEGLPGVGKTYLINEIKKINIKDLYLVDEIINPDINNPFIDAEDLFLKNDEMKVSKYNEGTIIIDRGPISTLVYNQVLKKIDDNYDLTIIENWFEQFIDLYKSDSVFTYYLNNPKEYNPSLDDHLNPFGSIENLKTTHELTLYNIKKYSKNYKIIDYYKDSTEELINEIIN